MDVKKLLFIVNPKSGKSLIKPHFCDIVDVFVAAGYDVCVHTTQAVRDAYQVARDRSREFDLIVCSGGDGTMDEAMSGLMELDIRKPLGYIPAGTTNDYAKSLGIPGNMVEAAKVAVSGVPKAVDVGVFNSRYFAYVAAFGAFTDVSYQTKQEQKNLMGHLTYVLEGIKSLPSITAYPMTVEFDDQVITGDFVYGMISNSISIGGFKSICSKDMALDDGVFELLLVRMPKNVLEFQAIVGAMLLQKVDEKLMVFARVSHVRLSSEWDVAWTLDGEDGGSHREVYIYNLCQGMEIVCPKDDHNV